MIKFKTTYHTYDIKFMDAKTSVLTYQLDENLSSESELFS